MVVQGLTSGFVIEALGGVRRSQVDALAQSDTFQIDHQYDTGELPYEGDHPCGPPRRGRLFVGGTGTGHANSKV